MLSQSLQLAFFKADRPAHAPVTLVTDVSSLSLFFNELRPSPSIFAVFKNAKPKPDERRPLHEAAQVIEESAPEEMPEDSWDHLYACLEWFARWSQRVIPIGRTALALSESGLPTA